DGQPTDDFAGGLKALLDQPWGKKAVRIAIAIGEDADLDVLQKFIAHSELRPLEANNPEALTRQIRWASTAGLNSASSPAAPAKLWRRRLTRCGGSSTRCGGSWIADLSSPSYRLSSDWRRSGCLTRWRELGQKE